MNQSPLNSSEAQPLNSADTGLWKWVVGGLFMAFFSFLAFKHILDTPENATGAPSAFTHFGAEVTSAFVGTGLTVAITALLLKFQTEKETGQQKELLEQQKKQQIELLGQQNEHAQRLQDQQAVANGRLINTQQKGDADRERGMTFYATKMKIYEDFLKELGKITTKNVLKGRRFHTTLDINSAPYLRCGF